MASENIRRNAEHPRDHYLTEAEVTRLFNAIDEAPVRQSALALNLMMLTGARKSEVLGMRWDEIDFEASAWIKPPSRTKQRTRHRVPLSEEAIKVLVELRSGTDGPFVFLLRANPVTLENLKRTWRWLRKQAGLGECRLHDLRHTYASLVIWWRFSRDDRSASWTFTGANNEAVRTFL